MTSAMSGFLIAGRGAYFMVTSSVVAERYCSHAESPKSASSWGYGTSDSTYCAR